jgi:glycosyltransferase involved in cell wall biosynthesis
MNSPIKLSIIVPIYNVAGYLRDCLDSILRQQLAAYEVLLINDGATDTSGLIAQEYATTNPDVFVYIEQKNRGLSGARNTGIDAARGDYLFFMDSDDYLADNGLPQLLEMAIQQQLEMVAGNFCHRHEDGSQKNNRAFIEIEAATGLAWLEDSLRKRKYIPAIWCKIYSREFIARHELNFVEGSVIEDHLFAIQSLVAAESFSAKNIPFYIYRHRDGSLTSRRDYRHALKSVESNIFSTVKMLEISNKKTNSVQRKLIMERCIKLLGKSALQLRQAATEESESLSTVIKQLDDLQLYRFVRFSRFSHIIDWITLRFGYDHYLNWRERKW